MSALNWLDGVRMCSLLGCLLFGGCCWAAELGGLAEFPATIPRCKAADVDCILATINRLIATAPNGIPELGVPALDPFRWPRPILTDLSGDRSALSVKLRTTNTTYWGLSRMRAVKVIGFTSDPRTSRFEILTVTPNVQILNNYRAVAQIFGIPIDRHGRSNCTLENFKSSLQLHPRIETRDGQEYVHFDQIKVNFTVSRFYMHFSSSQKNDPIGDSLNDILNENWRDIIDDLRPSFERSIAQLVRSIVQPLFASLPYADFFKPTGNPAVDPVVQ